MIWTIYMLFSLFYEIILWSLALIAFPRMLYHRFKHGKYKDSLAKRFGFGFPAIKKGKKKLIWIHAVSVGETKAVIPLVRLLKNQYKNSLILISSVTETGHAEAQKSLSQADFFVFLPFDFGFIIRPIVKMIKPDMVILSESDFWYNFLKSAKNNGAQIFLVNGKISKKSMQRFARFPSISQKIFSLIEHFCVQSEHYKIRFENLGVPSKKLTITGNLKFDAEFTQLPPDQLKKWRDQLGIQEGDQVVVIGSTHDPEERQLLEIFQNLWPKFPNLKAIFVPRHPERFNTVANIFASTNTPYIRFSRLNEKAFSKVILMDTMGLLKKCYQFADIAIVAGSFTPHIGGHNILEPAWYKVPTLYGPYMYSQPELLEIMQQHGAGIQVPMDQLKGTLENLLSNKIERVKLGEMGFKMVSGINGATNRTLQCLESFSG